MQISAARAGRRSPLSWGKTLLIAMVVEAALIVGSGSLILNAMARTEQAVEPPLEVLFDDVKKEEPRPEPPKPKPAPKPEVKLKPAAVPTPPVAAPQPVAPQTVNVTAAVSPAVEAPVVVAAAAPVTPPPPAPNNAAAQREAEFAAKVKAAIQAAVVYPSAARSMGFVGKARVEFLLRDGVPSKVKIIQGSNIVMIDRAALAAVANAAYPETPDSLKGKEQVYQVTVLFELTPAR